MKLPTMVAAAALATSSLAFAQAADATYLGLGGQAGIKQIVAALVPMLQADPRIAESFKDIDMVNVAMRLEEQFCELSGGPCRYKGKDMKEIHDGLNITNAQFNALAEDLQLAMDKAGVATRVQNRLLSKLAPMQKTVVTK